MKFFGRPDIEQMRRKGDVAGLVRWADFPRDLDVSREAVAGLRDNVYALVEHLYKTAVWADTHRRPGRGGLSPRGVYLLNQTVTALKKVGPPAVVPLADSVRVYDSYGEPLGHVRFLYFALVFDALGKIGRPATDELRALAASRDPDIRTPACETLEKLARRGQLERTDGDLDR